MKLAIALVALVRILASCVPATSPAPPNAQAPATFRGIASQERSIGDVPWRQLYDDPVLQTLIEQALVKNYDVQLAYTSILAAEANLGITVANQSVFVNGELQAPYTIVEGNRPLGTPQTQFSPQLGVAASYQADLFGRLASASGASRNQLLATQAAKNTVLATVVSLVATSYFELRELDEVLAITLRTVDDRRQDVRLMRIRVNGGESSLQDLRQAQESLYEVTQNVPVIRQGIRQTENAIALLAGDYPRAIARGLPLQRQVRLPALPPAGIAGDLLRRRPDIQQAEYTIAAAAGNVDVARKLLYPSLTLGASAAVTGSVVTGLDQGLPPRLSTAKNINGTFYGPLGLFAILPQLLQPIFNGGQIRSQIHLAQAQQQQAAVSYLQTVHQAFEEVSNDITAYNQSRLRTVELRRYDDASTDSVRLANMRYQGGYTSYLEVLDSQTRQYQAQIDLAQGELNERLALVQLYLALGGGWQQ
jgi:multidrug efflux system outer membrane protein